jgi:hypothetical protein
MRLHTPILIRPARIINLNFYPQLGNAACQTASGRGTHLYSGRLFSFAYHKLAEVLLLGK